MMYIVFLALFSASAAFPSDSPNKQASDVPIYTSDYLKKVLAESFVASVDQDIQSMLSTLGLTEAAKIAEEIDLNRILQEGGPAPFTVFMPSDDAVMKWKELEPRIAADRNALTKIIKASIVPGAMIQWSAMTDEKVVESMISSAKLRFNIYHKGNEEMKTVNGARMVKWDNMATNGVVHVVDKVVYPIPNGNAVEILSMVSHFSTLMKLVEHAGMTEIVSNADPVTVFAPTNQAFEDLPSGMLDDLMADTTKLQDVLKYHLIEKSIYTAGLSDGDSFASMQMGDIRVNIDQDGRFIVNDLATIVAPDAPANNGVIQTVDTVLLPPGRHFILV